MSAVVESTIEPTPQVSDRATLYGVPVTVVRSFDDCIADLRGAIADGESTRFITFVSPFSFHVARHDGDFIGELEQMDKIFPDGIGVVKALSWTQGIRALRVSFDTTSLYYPVMSALNEHKRNVFIVGAKPGVAERAVERMREDYPDIRFTGILDGYRSLDEMVQAVLDENPNFVLAGMGAPRQEKLLVALKEAGYRRMACTCGGFFDQLSERHDYYPAWANKHDLRWLYRLVTEPRKFWRRYIPNYTPFVLRTIYTALKIRLSGRRPEDQRA